MVSLNQKSSTACGVGAALAPAEEDGEEDGEAAGPAGERRVMANMMTASPKLRQRLFP